MVERDCLGNVVNGVDNFKVEVKCLQTAIIHLDEVVEEHLVPLFILQQSNGVTGTSNYRV